MDNTLQSSIRYATSGMQTQSFRLRVVSENLSNADTPGFKRKQVIFSQVYDAQSGTDQVQIDDVVLDRREGQRVFDPSHPLSDANGYVEMSNVEMMIELADAQQAARGYEANLSTFKQAMQMYQGLIDILRK